MSVSCRPFAWRSFHKSALLFGFAGTKDLLATRVLAALRGVGPMLALACGLAVSGPAAAFLAPGSPVANFESAVSPVRDVRAGPALGTVELSTLPPQAQETDRLIRQGGPFPYPKDGIVFGNRERVLPREARGYYHEYTVPTPGAGNRGARRIVCGGNPPNRPEACYYTDDHYQTFRLIKS